MDGKDKHKKAQAKAGITVICGVAVLYLTLLALLAGLYEAGWLPAAALSGPPSGHYLMYRYPAAPDYRSSSQNSNTARAAPLRPDSLCRSSTRRILPEMVLGSSQNSILRIRW